MRYSKRRIIVTSVISILCFFAIVFLIVKGINDSKKLTEADITNSKLTASVSNKKIEEAKTKVVTKESKKQTKTDTKEETTESNSKTSDEEHVKEVSEKKTTKKDVVEVTYDTGLDGKYTVVDLKKGDKVYSQEEIDNLKNDGYSMSLVIKKNGMAAVDVLDFSGNYAVDDRYFDDGSKKIEYSKNINRIRIQIEDMNIVFVKE